jgi:hypothetical protein
MTLKGFKPSQVFYVTDYAGAKKHRWLRDGRGSIIQDLHELCQRHVDAPGHSALVWAALAAIHSARTTSGFPFSTIYVASSAPLSLPTFFAE